MAQSHIKYMIQGQCKENIYFVLFFFLKDDKLGDRKLP